LQSCEFQIHDDLLALVGLQQDCMRIRCNPCAKGIRRVISMAYDDGPAPLM